jgi:hypothetical protein
MMHPIPSPTPTSGIVWHLKTAFDAFWQNDVEKLAALIVVVLAI